MFEKRQFSDYDMAEDYADRLRVMGYKGVMVVREFGKWWCYYKRF